MPYLASGWLWQIPESTTSLMANGLIKKCDLEFFSIWLRSLFNKELYERKEERKREREIDLGHWAGYRIMMDSRDCFPKRLVLDSTAMKSPGFLFVLVHRGGFWFGI